MSSVQSIARRAQALALAATLLAPSLAGPLPARADDATVRDHRDPTARLELQLTKVIVHDDRDPGAGEITVALRAWEVNDGCPADATADACIRELTSMYVIGLAASSGETISLDSTILPLPDPAATGRLIHAGTGIPVRAGRTYGWEISGVEKDDYTSDEHLGTLRGVMNESNGWGVVGSHTERAGDFSAEFEIRRTPLPDLQPTAFRVATELPGDRDDLVCFTVANRGPKPSAPFRVSIGMDGAAPLVPDIGASELAAGETREQCTGARLPDSGLHKLSVLVDREHTVPEMNDLNNLLSVGLDRTPAGQTRAPGDPVVATTDTGDAAPTGDGPIVLIPTTPRTGSTIGGRPTEPDLTIGAIRVNGRVPDGKADCAAGKNTVTAVIKNSGTADAEGFVARLVTDDAKGEAIEQSVGGLKAGQEREIRFDGVAVKKGGHTLAVTLDAKGAVAESDEQNNGRTVTATCRDAA